MNIGYLGPIGTFSEVAALKYTASNPSWKLFAYGDIPDIVAAVYQEEMEEGIIPFENSIEGSVTSSIDSLLLNSHVFIKKEITIPIEQCLLAQKQLPVENVKKIISHSQGLAQCRGYIKKNFPNAEVESVSSTAQAAAIASSSVNVAAIAPQRAAAVYDLKVIAKDIADNIHNKTRFVVLSAQKNSIQSGQKASIAFSTENKPGGLYRILDILNIWDLNMTKIESRPCKNELGTYLFFVDVDILSEEDFMNAIHMIERKTSFFQFLGSYPAG